MTAQAATPINPDTTGSQESAGVSTPEKPDVFKQEDPKFMDKLKAAGEKYDAIKGERKKLNASMEELMATFENDGLNRKAVKAAISYVSMNEKDQQNYDLSYTIMRKAMGQPVQGDLFEAKVASEMKDRQKH